MLRYRKMLGLPVLILEQGKILGHVYDIMFNLEKKYTAGVCIRNTVKNYYIKSGDISHEDGRLIIQSRNIVIELGKAFLSQQELTKGRDLLDKKLLTYKGEDIGYLNDICFDFELGTIDALELTDGIIQDIISGRKLIPIVGNILLKEEGVFLGREALEEIIDREKGLQHLLFNK